MRDAAFRREVGVLADAVFRGNDEVFRVEGADEDDAAVRFRSELVGPGRVLRNGVPLCKRLSAPRIKARKGERKTYVRPGDLANIEELVVTSSDDAVVLRLFSLSLRNLLREQSSSSSRERAGFTLVSVIRHFPARQDPLDILPVLTLDRQVVLR
jgi:hypothetical protein